MSLCGVCTSTLVLFAGRGFFPRKERDHVEKHKAPPPGLSVLRYNFQFTIYNSQKWPGTNHCRKKWHAIRHARCAHLSDARSGHSEGGARRRVATLRRVVRRVSTQQGARRQHRVRHTKCVTRRVTLEVNGRWANSSLGSHQMRHTWNL